MVDFLILYEHRQRELNNACLLKYELEKRGYKVKISCIYSIEYENLIQPFYYMNPKVVIVPWLYGNTEVEKLKKMFRKASFKIVDLQCEQVLSKKWIDAKYHFPKDNAKEAFHICWGKNSYERLIELGISTNNILLTGSISTDFDRDIFHSLFDSREQIASIYNLDTQKKWLLFISSFTFSNITVDELNEIKERTNVDNSKFRDVMNESKKNIVSWLVRFANEHPDYEIIYRPHPNEKNDENLKNIFGQYSNMNIISQYSVGQWIYISDYINNWISTSIVDAVYMHKKTCVLRPVTVDVYDDSELLIGLKHIKNYDDFTSFNCNKDTFLMEQIDISKYYQFDNIPSYIQTANCLEKILIGEGKTFHSQPKKRINWIKSAMAYSCYYTKLSFKLTHNEQLLDISKEVYMIKKEKKKIIRKLKKVLLDEVNEYVQ